MEGFNGVSNVELVDDGSVEQGSDGRNTRRDE